jgi:hypothetical protein
MNLINRTIRLLEQRMLRKLERYVSSRSGAGLPAAPAMFVNASYQ